MKNFISFFRVFSFFSNVEVSGKSHSAEKCERGTLWDFLNIHSVAKYQKLMGGTIKKFRKNMRILNSLTVPKKRGKSQCRKKWKGRPFCFGMAFYLMLEALDALKISTKYIW